MRIGVFFLVLSLMIHFLTWKAAYLGHQNRTLQTEPVEVTIVDKKTPLATHKDDERPKQMVRQALPPLKLLKPLVDEPAHYLSENDQRVEKEMHATATGLTQNRNQSGPQSPGENGEDGKEKNLKDQDSDTDGPTHIPSSKRLGKLGETLFVQNSTSGEYLPDVEQGPITALNTERFIYYSFFARVEERIRPLWERNIHYSHSHISSSELRKLSGQNEWVTGVEILLSPDGRFIDAIVHQSSGSEMLDRDAITAFREASLFPNPPKKMLQKDGRVHLKYVFVVQETNSWARR